MNKTIAKNYEDFIELFKLVKGMNPDCYLEVTIKPWKSSRSIDQNSLYWLWLGKLAKHFSKKSIFSKDQMHDLMRHKFLGYEDRSVSNTEISLQLKSTRDCSTHAMSIYMNLVEMWAADHGCLLPRPEDQAHVYNEYREAAQ